MELEVLQVTKTERKTPADAWQELLCRLDGISAARVVFSDDNIPKEIHILATDEKSPKALTRDIQSALAAAFDATVDHRIISIAQFQKPVEEVERPEFEKDPRLRFVGIETKVFDGCGEITVFLTRGEEHRIGKASFSGKHSFSRCRGVALATLDAVSKYLNRNEQGCWFELLSVETAEMGGKQVAFAVLCDEEEQQLLGTSVVTEGNDDAIVRAVLDALNRRISKFLTK